MLPSGASPVDASVAASGPSSAPSAWGGAVVKGLWQQRTFVQLLGRILAAVDRAKEGPQEARPSASLGLLCIALCTLIGSTPTQVISGPGIINPNRRALLSTCALAERSVLRLPSALPSPPCCLA
jgi:hypothetical protein